MILNERWVIQTRSQILKTILIGIFALPLLGLLYDAWNGFYVLRNSKSIYGLVIGLMVTALFAFAGEYVLGVLNAKDKVSDPLYKRVFHLLVLVAAVGVVGFIYWFIFQYFELLKI